MLEKQNDTRLYRHTWTRATQVKETGTDTNRVHELVLGNSRNLPGWRQLGGHRKQEEHRRVEAHVRAPL